MEPIDYLSAFYGQTHTRETLPGAIEGVIDAHRVAARALPFYSHVAPGEFLRRSLAGWQCHVEEMGPGVQLYTGTAPFKDPDGERQRKRVFFFVYDHSEYPNVYVLLTLEDSRTFASLRAAIEGAFPTVITTFITHRRLERLMESFQSQNNLSRLVIKRASCRLRLPAREKAGSRRVMPVVSWPQMDLREAFDWLREHDGWFQSLEFDAWQDHRLLASVSFSRQGITRATGLFSKVSAGFVDPVCKTIDENVRFFGQRARRDRDDLSVRPVVIDFESDDIASAEDRQLFVQAMRSFPAASVSVLHGNPYVHLSILDYYDGSLFDVWVLSGSEICIVPQMKGSVAASKRLVRHIFDEYAEGSLREYSGGQG